MLVHMATIATCAGTRPRAANTTWEGAITWATMALITTTVTIVEIDDTHRMDAIDISIAPEVVVGTHATQTGNLLLS